MHNPSIYQLEGSDQEDLESIVNNQAWVPTGFPLSKLSSGPLMIVPGASRIVDSR